jgi:LAS superfamily LD-carboxypeptidase LdcB
MNKGILFLFFIIAAGAVGYLAYSNHTLEQSKAALANELAKTKQDLSDTTKKLNNEITNLNTDVATLGELLDSTKAELATTTAQLDLTTRDLADANAARIDFETQYNIEKNKVSDLGSQVSDLQGTVGTLQKLSETDPELLKKYSRVYFLNENYKPRSLSKIDPKYTYNSDQTYEFYTDTLPFLNLLLSTAQADGVDLKVISAYRSFGEQTSLKTSYKMTYGLGADKFSADQGYSEHQLGTAVDFTTSTVGDSFTGFENTPAYQWLLDNAYTFGFIMSYPEGNTYYQYEPWHWRFVGRDLAKKLHDEQKNFYDLDQRAIDQYLISFFD